MRRELMLGAMLGAMILSGCTKRQVLGNASDLPIGADGTETYESGGDAALARLQADLAANAGDRVFFALDTYTLSAEARITLARQAQWLREHPRVAILIEGHADERGTREYNLALGDHRARATAEFLTLQGIASSRISTISYGKERADALGSDEAAYAKNRRAVSVVLHLQ